MSAWLKYQLTLTQLVDKILTLKETNPNWISAEATLLEMSRLAASAAHYAKLAREEVPE